MFISNEQSIIEQLKVNINQLKKFSVIEGISGSGKTFILEKVKEDLLDVNFYWLKGDSYLTSRNYYPFYELIKQLYNDHEKQRKKVLLRETTKDILTNAGSVSPLGSEFISAAIENAIEFKENNQKLTNCIFSQEELQIIFHLNYFCEEKNKTVFLCDDIQYWDEKSMQLLYLLTKTSSLQIEILIEPLFVASITQNESIENELVHIYEIAKNNIYHIDAIHPADYQMTLNALGLKFELDDDLIHALYSITSGNLQLSNDVVKLLNTSNKVTEETVSEIIEGKNLGHLLIERLNSIPPGSDVNEALKFASLFGNTFRYYELEQALMKNEGSIRKFLKFAEKHSLVKNYATSATFVHELIRKAYKEELSYEKEKYYLRYSECVKILYPGNYRLRADSLYCAGEFENSSIIYILEYLRALRNNAVNVDKEKYLYLASGHLFDFVNRMETSYKNFNTGKFKECLDELRLIEDIYAMPLLAEKYFLMSITLSKWLDSEFRTIARECLIPFLELEKIDCERELWERILSAYIVACIHDNHRNDAEKYEKILNESITTRLAYDFDASFKLNILRRKSSMLYGEEKTFLLTQKSKNFFSTNFEKVLDPIQYYMSLTNYLAAALKNGETDSISLDITALIKLPDQYPYLHFQRMEMPLNNIIIASYIRKEVTAEKAIKLLYKVLDTYTTEETTNTVILSNIAVLYALNRDFSKAYSILFEIHTQFCDIENLEFYYKYLIDRNLSAICFATGDKKTAIDLLENLLSINNLSQRKSFKYQTNQLLKNIKEDMPQIGYEWYINPLEYPKSSSAPPFWSYYGRKYLFGELEFWSES